MLSTPGLESGRTMLLIADLLEHFNRIVEPNVGLLDQAGKLASIIVRTRCVSEGIRSRSGGLSQPKRTHGEGGADDR